MRATITCDSCGHRMNLARLILEPERLYLVCHECEGVLRVDITSDTLTRPVKNPLAIYSQ